MTVNPHHKVGHAMIVGTEGGALYRSTCVGENPYGRTSSSYSALFKPALHPMLHYLNNTQLEKLTKHSTAYAKQRGLKTVDMQTIYASKPPIGTLYLSAMEFQFDGHTGPVLDLAWSPFHRKLFLSCSVDGVVHLHSSIQVNYLVYEQFNIHNRIEHLPLSSQARVTRLL